MKNGLILLLSLLFYVTGIAQNSRYELPERQTPVFSKEKLSNAQRVNDLTPALWASLQLSSAERYYLDQRRVNEFPQPTNYKYPQERYAQILEVVFTEISVNTNGKTISAQSTSDKLTEQQKNILSNADLGTDVTVKLKYKYKDQTKDSFGPRNKVVEGTAQITVVPEKEAEYPGGFKQFSSYIKTQVLDKVNTPKASDILWRAVISFTVTEDGQVINTKLSRSTENAQMDKLLLDALSKMPKWNPAVNGKGEKVKQEFVIPFGVGC